jgi:hypothetical protein
MGLNDPVLRAAAGIDPSVEPTLGAQDEAVFSIPEFTTEFKSAGFPALDGPVTVRYATIGDTVAIERAMGPLAGFVAEAVASLQVLITKAPASWWRAPEKGGKLPVLDLSRLPDVEGILDLYRDYSKWRADFRIGGSGS